MSQRYHSLPYRFISLRRRFHIYLRFLFFFFNDPAPTEIYPLSLPDPLPICRQRATEIGQRLEYRRETLNYGEFTLQAEGRHLSGDNFGNGLGMGGLSIGGLSIGG